MCVRGRRRQGRKRPHLHRPACLPFVIKKGELSLGRGPEENRWKPSIDVLFRSAAAAYNSRVTGIILTGLLDDGTSGMSAIKRSGGTSIVQDPNQAEYPDMPMSDTPVPPEVVAEAAIAEKMATGIELVETLGEGSNYTCPDCGGSLGNVRNDVANRFRCFTGHSYSESDLVVKQSENIEATLWVALRMMEERKNLLKKMEQQTRDRGFERYAKDHKAKGEEFNNTSTN